MRQTNNDSVAAPSSLPDAGDRESCRQPPEDVATATAAPNSKPPAAGRIRFFRPLPRDLTEVASMLEAAGWAIVFVSDRVGGDGRHRITAREPLHGAELAAALLSDEVAADPIAWYLDDDFTHTTTKGTPNEVHIHRLD